MNRKIRILVADDHAIVRMGISALLGAENDMDVIGEAKNGREAVNLAAELRPDVIIMDLMMPKMDGVQATAELHVALPSVKVVILTSFGSSDNISSALHAGASAALMKTAENAELIKAIREVVAGKTYVSAHVKSLLKEDPPVPELTPRQREILDSISRGLTNAEIAQQLGISVASVKTHVLALFNKIGAANRSEAVAIGLGKHLLKTLRISGGD